MDQHGGGIEAPLGIAAMPARRRRVGPGCGIDPGPTERPARYNPNRSLILSAHSAAVSAALSTTRS